MIQDWLHYALRLFHLIAGIMWIGTSFYFVWLDYAFEPLAEKLAEKKEGVEGETYMVHGGFFYRVKKQRPVTLPKNLHWFKYEALLTWVSGVLLLLLVYWTGGGMALVGATRIPLHPHAAMAVSLGTLVVAWAIYDTLWRLVGKRAPTVALVASLALLLGAIYFLCSVFPGRAAFIHVGAMLGTIMISNHFSSAFDHPLNWVLLSILCVVGASVRHLMITIERRQTAWWAFAPATLGVAALVLMTMPREIPPDTSPPVPFAQANEIITARCRRCHSATPTDDVFRTAPNGVAFDTPAAIQAYAPRIRLRAVEARTMPLGNQTGMTDDEREILRRWIDQGARTQ